LQVVLNNITENGFHGFWSVGKTTGSLYTFPRRLFWMRWEPKLSKLSRQFFFDLVQELSDSTSQNDLTTPTPCLRK
jgi:hypothetical protein